MTPLRQTATLIAWAGFIWLMLSKITHSPISETLWINAVYVIISIAIATIAVLTAIVFANRRFQPSPVAQMAIGFFVVLLLAAIDTLWLRDLFAARQ